MDLEKFSFELRDKRPHSWGVSVPDNQSFVLLEPIAIVDLGNSACLRECAVGRDNELSLSKEGERNIGE